MLNDFYKDYGKMVANEQRSDHMLNDFYKQFKSGTDIRGVAVEGVEGQPVNLTDEAVRNMADGFVLWLSEKVGKSADKLKISIGRDSRI